MGSSDDNGESTSAAIAYPQTTNTYPSTPQAQNFWDAGNETILDEGTGELCCR